MIRPAVFAAALLSSTACSASPQAAAPLPKNSPAEPSIVNVPATTGRANLPETPPPFAIATMGKFEAPFAMAFLPDGRLLVTEKAGKLKLRAIDGTVTDVAGVPVVAGGGQGGLLDVALAPDFATSHAIYLSYAEGTSGASQLALARATLNLSGAPGLADVKVIWRSGSAGPGGQFGAAIAFSPDGKYLFLSSGERQRFTPAQDPAQALGKIERLTLDGSPAPGTWTSGHRNPYGLQFDSGGRLWEVEMGPKGGDELNLIEQGSNYGWPIVSNGDNYSGQAIPDHPSRPDFAAPKLWWNPSISPGGLMIYSGAMFPQYSGDAFIAALSGQALIRVKLNGERAMPAEQWGMDARIRDVAQGPDGAIWLLEDEGRLLRLTPKS